MKLGPVCLPVLLFFASACSSSSPPSSSDPGSSRTPPTSEGSDGGPPAQTSPSEGSPDAASTQDGLLMAVQGTPPPAPGKPTPFILVGCPSNGFVELRFYTLAEDGTKHDAGRRVGAYTKSGLANHIEVDDGDRKSVEIDLVEKDSAATAPFLYVTTVVTDPALLVTSEHSFATRMLNPAWPDQKDVGMAFPEKLVQCP